MLSCRLEFFTDIANIYLSNYPATKILAIAGLLRRLPNPYSLEVELGNDDALSPR